MPIVQEVFVLTPCSKHFISFCILQALGTMVVRFINLLILDYPAQSAFLCKQAGLVMHLEQMLEPPCALYFILRYSARMNQNSCTGSVQKSKGADFYPSFCGHWAASVQCVSISYYSESSRLSIFLALFNFWKMFRYTLRIMISNQLAVRVKLKCALLQCPFSQVLHINNYWIKTVFGSTNMHVIRAFLVQQQD